MNENRYVKCCEIMGQDYALRQTAEECAELAQSCLKLVRAMNGETPVSVDAAKEDLLEDLLEELADVRNMVEVMTISLTMDEYSRMRNIQDYKLDRMCDRLKIEVFGDEP